MEPGILRDEYGLARRYTQSLYANLSKAEVPWRSGPKSSGITWHLGHQVAVNHFLLHNPFAAEPSLNPQRGALVDAAKSEENRGSLPPLTEIRACCKAVVCHAHTHLDALLTGRHASAYTETICHT